MDIKVSFVIKYFHVKTKVCQVMFEKNEPLTLGFAILVTLFTTELKFQQKKNTKNPPQSEGILLDLPSCLRSEEHPTNYSKSMGILHVEQCTAQCGTD